MVGGNVFHRVRPETVELLRPYLVVLQQGTTKQPCAEDGLVGL